jgi:hypothetical protein
MLKLNNKTQFAILKFKKIKLNREKKYFLHQNCRIFYSFFYELIIKEKFTEGVNLNLIKKID